MIQFFDHAPFFVTGFFFAFRIIADMPARIQKTVGCASCVAAGSDCAAEGTAPPTLQQLLVAVKSDYEADSQCLEPVKAMIYRLFKAQAVLKDGGGTNTGGKGRGGATVFVERRSGVTVEAARDGNMPVHAKAKWFLKIILLVQGSDAVQAGLDDLTLQVAAQPDNSAAQNPSPHFYSHVYTHVHTHVHTCLYTYPQTCVYMTRCCQRSARL